MQSSVHAGSNHARQLFMQSVSFDDVQIMAQSSSLLAMSKN